MSKQDYDVLEQEIGDAGAQPTNSLGKVSRKEITGGHSDLGADEEASFEAFRDRSNSTIAAREKERSTPLTDGWILVDRDEMGIRSKFYPSDWKFYIKPATVQTIKNWTAVDEERPEVVLQVLNEIIRSSVKVETDEGAGSWKDINTWDQFWFIMKVREATFSKGESKVEFEDECSNCGSMMTYTLTPQSLAFDYPDEEIIDHHWLGNRWEIDPEEYGVQAPLITLYNPRLGSNTIVVEWAQSQARMNKKVDEQFLSYLLWTLPRTPKSVQALDIHVKKVKKEYDGWSLEMFNLMREILANLPVNPSENLQQPCPHCGAEVTSAVRFPSGLKVLFNTTPTRKFGSRAV